MFSKSISDRSAPHHGIGRPRKCFRAFSRNFRIHSGSDFSSEISETTASDSPRLGLNTECWGSAQPKRYPWSSSFRSGFATISFPSLDAPSGNIYPGGRISPTDGINAPGGAGRPHLKASEDRPGRVRCDQEPAPRHFPRRDDDRAAELGNLPRGLVGVGDDEVRHPARRGLRGVLVHRPHPADQQVLAHRDRPVDRGQLPERPAEQAAVEGLGSVRVPGGEIAPRPRPGLVDQPGAVEPRGLPQTDPGPVAAGDHRHPGRAGDVVGPVLDRPAQILNPRQRRVEVVDRDVRVPAVGVGLPVAVEAGDVLPVDASDEVRARVGALHLLDRPAEQAPVEGACPVQVLGAQVDPAERALRVPADLAHQPGTATPTRRPINEAAPTPTVAMATSSRPAINGRSPVYRLRTAPATSRAAAVTTNEATSATSPSVNRNGTTGTMPPARNDTNTTAAAPSGRPNWADSPSSSLIMTLSQTCGSEVIRSTTRSSSSPSKPRSR